DASPLVLGRQASEFFAIEFDRFPSAAIRAVAADEKGVERMLASEVSDGIPLGAVDPVGSHIHAILGEDAPTASLAGLEHDDVVAPVSRPLGCGQSRQTRTDNNDSFAYHSLECLLRPSELGGYSGMQLSSTRA